MKKPNNFKLTEHFSFYELIEGAATAKAGHVMNWQHIDECNVSALKELCRRMELVRKDINVNFISDTGAGEIGLNVTSGWRCLAWELFRKRSGKGQHPIAAMDVLPSGCSRKMQGEILIYLHRKYVNTKTGWKGGFAVKRQSEISTGFAHFDIRGEIARWHY